MYFNRDRLEIKETISSGSYGSVLLVEDKFNKNKYAMKEILYSHPKYSSEEEFKNSIINEIKILE